MLHFINRIIWTAYIAGGMLRTLLIVYVVSSKHIIRGCWRKSAEQCRKQS